MLRDRWKIWQFVMRKGMKLGLFPVPVGPEVDNPTGVQYLIHFFSTTNWLRLPTAATLPNDGFSTGKLSTSGRATSVSGLDAFPDPSACSSAQTTILGSIERLSRDWTKDHLSGFGTGDHFRSAYFRFRWSSPGNQRSSPSRRGNMLASGVGQPDFPPGKRGFWHGITLNYANWRKLRLTFRPTAWEFTLISRLKRANFAIFRLGILLTTSRYETDTRLEP